MSLSSWFVAILVLYIVVNLAIAYTLVFVERRAPDKTLSWLMVISLLPVVGVIIYFAVGQDLSERKLFHEKEQEDLKRLLEQQKAMFYERNEISRHQSKHFQLMNIALNSNNAPLMFDNKIKILKNGEEKFPELLECLENAKKHIHVQYYIFREKGIGKQILELLMKKAGEGVQVRLLVDGMGNYISKRTFRKLRNAGVECSVFFPTKVPLVVNRRLNYRNHRKIVIIDGMVGFFGGLNIGDEYLGKNKKYGYFRDTHYKVQGDIVHELQLRFAMDWEFASGKEIDESRYYFPQSDVEGNVDMQVLTTGPDSKQPTIKHALYEMISNAQKKIQIVTPYYIPDAAITGLLKNAIMSGVEVEVIIPSVIDHPFVHWASTSHLSDIIDMGAKAYIYDKGFIHSKIVLVDDEISLIGTANFDIRSWVYNFEISALVYDEAFTKQMSYDFENDKRESSHLSKEVYSQRNRIWRIKEAFCRLWSPLL